ncbi:VCBS repeat-containing protein/40-residue YVTN family beta-propeller repeat-containing protein [Mycolicibacterium rutilum]|uniref:VCBS repeat-containing protein/40-residue YVTN family beta-propeller repeat-containing protein n=1 Tax=Mycolicibacterium rutilum TaxID=370526 RepID=A0A1H6KF15_MYCRU|nr:Ig-like domain-containing protein [Mycolicibacterium rutilum]SEH70402.1 VCBS repeat-containing protein/40-residue YVTN family beta-propeller repeat-containing protein [Mycolicibacterium rutilum]
MGYSGYIGRVGALAVALGIGFAVGSPAGVVWAEPTDGSAADSNPSADQSADSPTKPEAAAGDESTEPEPETDPVEELDDAVESDPDDATPPTVEPDPEPEQVDEPAAKVDKNDKNDALNAEPTEPAYANRVSGPSAAATPADVPDSQFRSAGEPVEQPVEAPAEQFVAATLLQEDQQEQENQEAQAPVPAPTPPPSIFTALNTLVAPAISAFFGALSDNPTSSPLAWLFAAFARRDVGETTAAAAANQSPTVSTEFDSPAAATGAVTGTIVAVDPEGNKLTYKLTSAPADGTVTFNAKTATFTYTPTTAQRILAATTPELDTVAMTVTVSDGTNNVVQVIDVPVGEAPIAKLADIGPINDSTAVVTTATRAYVTNRAAGTVTVIDTVNNTVVGTLAAGPTPDALAIKPDGTRLYVSSAENNTVTVLNTATGAVVKTIAVTSPKAMAISPRGDVLYVATDSGTLTRINTTFNSIDSVAKLPAGTKPTGLVVGSDGATAYVIGTKPDGTGSVSVTRYAWFSTQTSAFAESPASPTSIAISPDNKRLYVGAADGTLTVYDTGSRAVLGSYNTIGEDPITGLTVSRDGTMVTAVNQRGWVLTVEPKTGELLRMFWTRPEVDPLSAASRMAATPDGRQLYITNSDAGTVYAVSLIGPNTAPTTAAPTTHAPNTTTGAVTGKIVAADVDKDPLTYAVTSGPTKGKLTLKTDGTFTYTPTAAARHAAAVADESLKTDSFTVAVSDGRGGVAYSTVEIDISATNKTPTVTKTVGNPNSSTGVVTGKISASDGDKDALSYAVTSGPAKGTLTLAPNGSFTYTPTAEARREAARTGAPATATQDTFSLTVDDGHGGVVPVTVTVKVSPLNSKPTGVTAADVWANPNSGVVTGKLSATDADNDTLTYSVSAPKTGTLVVGEDGRFAYTPTDAARRAASSPWAAPWNKQETVTVTVTDGYGGTATYKLNLTIRPYGHVNAAPTNPTATVSDPTLAIGTVTGVVSVVDPERDALTYTVETGPTRGVVKVDAATGAFTYVPDVESRYAAAASPSNATDTFTVTVSDGYGGTTTTTVVVAVAPPDTAASAIDQRATTVAVATPEFWWYSDEDLATGLDLMKESGVDTIRILIPWFLVEPEDDVWTWDRTDRLVYGARDRGIKVLAVLNHPPEWAVTPGTDPLVGSPADPAEYAEYVGMVATRYKGEVGAYEIWNEPNGQMFWQPKPNAADYTKLLQAAYPVIKEIDPDAVVIAGSIGAILDEGDWATDSVRFLKEMYEAGAAGYFDALSYHPYHYTTPFSTGAWLQGSPINQLDEMRALMTAHGDGNKKIWATEYGQPASVESEVNQAYYIADFLQAWRDLDYAGPAFIHTIRDLPPEIENPVEESLGLWRWDWSRKLALGVVETIIEENKERLNQPPSEL